MTAARRVRPVASHIPGHIWQRDDLTLREKVIVAEVDAYSRGGEVCSMTNEGFAALCECSEEEARALVSGLVGRGVLLLRLGSWDEGDPGERYLRTKEGRG